MKHLKLTLFSFIALFISASTVISCSSDNDNNQIQEHDLDHKTDAFLKKFYSSDYHLGKSATASNSNPYGLQNRSAHVDNYIVTEVFVNNEVRASGYLFENLQTNKYENFIDVDRINYILTSVNLQNNEVEVQNRINERPEYSLTHEFDIIRVIENPINTNPSNPGYVTYGWHYEWGACRDGFRGKYKAYYFLGIRLTQWEPVKKDDGVTNETYPC